MRTREQIMQEWDSVRAKIASGCTHSGPSDWLDGVLDDIETTEREACATAAATLDAGDQGLHETYADGRRAAAAKIRARSKSK